MSEDSDKIRAEHFRQLNAYQDDPSYKALQGYEDRVAFFASMVGRKWEIDEAIFEEFLNLMPPLGWRGDRFYLSEFLFDDITHRFSQEDGRYFCEIATYPPRPAAGAKAAPIGTPKA